MTSRLSFRRPVRTQSRLAPDAASLHPAHHNAEIQLPFVPTGTLPKFAFRVILASGCFHISYSIVAEGRFVSFPFRMTNCPPPSAFRAPPAKWNVLRATSASATGEHQTLMACFSPNYFKQYLSQSHIIDNWPDLAANVLNPTQSRLRRSALMQYLSWPAAAQLGVDAQEDTDDARSNIITQSAHPRGPSFGLGFGVESAAHNPLAKPVLMDFPPILPILTPLLLASDSEPINRAPVRPGQGSAGTVTGCRAERGQP